MLIADVDDGIPILSQTILFLFSLGFAFVFMNVVFVYLYVFLTTQINRMNSSWVDLMEV